MRRRARRNRPRPAEPLKPRPDLTEIQVQIIATAETDELTRADVAAFYPAIYEMDRPAPHEGRPAVLRLTGERTGHDVRGRGTAHLLTARHLTHHQVGEFCPRRGLKQRYALLTAR
jgi:hypothetical protein